MDFDALLRHRSERDAFFAEHYASPLPDELRASFAGLSYYPPNPAWVITGRFDPVDRRPIPIPSTAGTESDYTMIGEVVVSIGEREYRLVALDDGDGDPFLPFRDATAGATTYSGGRYVRPEIADDGTAIIDFNRASNPWCAYDTEFICPLPPQPNIIASGIEAGEQNWLLPT